MTARRLALALAALALVVSSRPAHAAPAIVAIDVQTTPLFRGIPFEIAVTASPDVVQATATVDFRPWATSLLRVPLAKVSGEWVATATVPLGVVPRGAPATVKVIAFDAARARAESAIHVPVSPLSAVFSPDDGELDIIGSPADDTITVSRDAAGQLSVNGGAIPIARGPATVANTTQIDIYGQAGDDHLTLDRANGLLPPGQLYGGDGDDVLVGGGSADMLYGDDGNDVLDGGPGDDFSVAGPGDDTFLWRPGDGNDSLQGLDGSDTLRFTGSNAAESIALSADGSLLRLRRDVGNVLLDAAGIENVDLALLGGADMLIVEPLGDTEVVAIRVDLASPAGSGAGDGAGDSVVLFGTNGDDVATLSGSAGALSVVGLGPAVALAGSEPANDRLTVSMLGGDDVIDGTALAASAIALTEEGGDGNDILVGGDGADVLLGGAGDDVLLGGPGADVLDGGPGDNVLIQ